VEIKFIAPPHSILVQADTHFPPDQRLRAISLDGGFVDLVFLGGFIE